jgi:hypothetical protein
MIIYAVITRGGTLLAEYGTAPDGFSEKILAIVARNSNGSGTRLVSIGGDQLCAVMSKTISKETISFAAIIESNEERDNSFNFLDSLGLFFERESNNPKMTSEMNNFLSKHIKTQMVLQV